MTRQARFLFPPLAATLALLAGCAAAPAPHTNISAPDLGKLFDNHVYVYHMPQWVGYNGETAIAEYWRPDGVEAWCGIDMRRKQPKTLFPGHWKVIDRPGGGAKICDIDPGQQFRADHNDCGPLSWDPASGHVTDHTQDLRTHRWSVPRVGHFQASWPKVMLERCPGLKLPPDLPVNDKQTSAKYEELVAQDPDAVLTGTDLGISELPLALDIKDLPDLAGTVMVWRQAKLADTSVVPVAEPKTDLLEVFAFEAKGKVRVCALASFPYMELRAKETDGYDFKPDTEYGGTGGFWFNLKNPKSKELWNQWTSWYDGPDGLDVHGSMNFNDIPGIGIFDGWLQKSLPQVFAERCGDLFSDGAFALNAAQTRLDYRDLGAHADRVVRPGHEGGAPAPEPLAIREQRALGQILASDGTLFKRGPQDYMAFYADRNELWRGPAPGQVTDIATLKRPSRQKDAGLVLHWQRSGETQRFDRIMDFYHWVWHPTGQRHPLRVLLDQLTAPETALTLPEELSGHKILLAADGTISLPETGPAGHWELDGDDLLIANDTGRMETVDLHVLAALNGLDDPSAETGQTTPARPPANTPGEPADDAS